MVDAAIKAETPTAAPAATDEAAQDVEMLSRMTDLAMELARAFQAQALAALQAGDLDRAARCEAGFNRLFLGIRRAIALRAKLRRQREQQQRQTEAHRDGLQDEKDDRRRVVAEGLSRAIAAGKPEAKERLTVELWTRLAEDERIDADLADRALPIETLILRLGRAIGLSRRALGIGLDPDAKADPAAAGRTAWGEPPAVAPPPEDPPPRDPPRPSFTYVRGIWASDVGGPEGESWVHNVTTGEVFDTSGKLVRTLPVPDHPNRPGAADSVMPAKAEAAAPPEPDPPPETDDERRRRERDEQLRLHGLRPHQS